jgi:hypothetical protein
MSEPTRRDLNQGDHRIEKNTSNEDLPSPRRTLG